MKNINLEILDKTRFEHIQMLTRDEVKSALDYAVKKIDSILDIYTHSFPSACTTNQIYRIKGNDDWTNGFWTAMIWLAYEYTGDEKYKKVAETHMENFKKRCDEHFVMDHHDLGFLFSLSTVAGYKLTGNEEAKKTSIKAAYKLIDRYHEKGQFIQAWGKKGDPEEYRLIIDSLLNLPLLYWAYEETKDEKLKEIADNHFNSVISTVVREDASSYHTYYFNMETGVPEKGVTLQGYADDSCWARGQSWSVCGMPFNFRYNKNEEAKYIYERTLHYFLNRLPEDLVCYWDLIFKDGDGHPRDTSSSAIVACGIFEMDKYLESDNDLKETYMKAAHGMLRSLMEKYTTKNIDNSQGILTEGVYYYKGNKGINECNLWGDYYYMEALMRLYKDWNLYW